MKKLLPFIIILSLILPFFPSIDVFAFDEETGSVSMDDILDDLGLVNVDGLIVSKGVSDFSNQIVSYLGNLGYVTRDNATDVVIDFFANEAGIPYAGSSSNSFNAQDVIDWLDLNYTPSLSQNIINYSLTFAQENAPYFIYSAIPISDFFTKFDMSPVAYPTNQALFKSNLISKVNSFGTLCAFTCSGGRLTSNPSYVFSFSEDLLNEYHFVLNGGSFSRFPDWTYQVIVVNGFPDNADGVSLDGRLILNDGNANYTGTIPYYGNDGLLQGDTIHQSSNYYNNLYCGMFNDSRLTNGAFPYFDGTLFCVPDSWGTYYFLVFKSQRQLFLFTSGDSPVYHFKSDLKIPEGADIDYSKLYDIISTEVSHSTGNVIDSINGVANNYLQQQLDLLHDINNALNDGTGQSWLRRIYGILDYNFPLTLSAFDDLIDSVQNISVSGGDGDFSEATQVLHEIDTKLGILIDEPFTDLTDNDWDQLKSRVQTKFPFCIFSDIVAISVILNRPPQQPDLNFPIPIIGSESENVVHIDLSPYEHARPYVHGALIFVFIIGLLALSVKIFDHLKS